MNIYVLALFISLGINFLFFLLANALKTDKFTDFTYGLTFTALAFLFLFKNQTFYRYQLLLMVMVVLWSIRLITYLLIRILKIKKDSRFNKIRENPLKFLQFWVFQGLTVWIVMLPSIFLLNIKEPKPLNTIMVSGIIIWAFGLLIETISDWQKFGFKNNPKNKNLWIQSGLWKYSRHPNYFGEIILWTGISIIALPTMEGLKFVVLISPIFVYVLLTKISGIPMLEKSSDIKWKNDPSYIEYKKNTPVLFLKKPNF